MKLKYPDSNHFVWLFNSPTMLAADPGSRLLIEHFFFQLKYSKIKNLVWCFRACADCLKGNKADCLRKDCITADGFEREMLCINRQLPGPSIQVGIIIFNKKRKRTEFSTILKISASSKKV